MSTHLVPAFPDLSGARAQLAALEAQLAGRERELRDLQHELQALQARYFETLGALYAELTELNVAIVDAETRLGLRQPGAAHDSGDDDDDAGRPQDAVVSCSNRPVPSDDLKKMFRDLAKAIHPDLAVDEPARYRRHSLMAEANRAYAERDEDRLRLIMRAWERAPESVSGEDAEAEHIRLARRMAGVEMRLAAMDAHHDDLRRAAIYRLKDKIDAARRQGWDLFAEMVLQMRREISTARARLASLSR
jgi:hypothetical protein